MSGEPMLTIAAAGLIALTATLGAGPAKTPAR